MKKLSKIEESVWGGMLSRSTGDTIRKEDDVNLLDMEGFEKYIESHYTLIEKYKDCVMVSSNKIHTSLVILVFAIQGDGTSYFHIFLKEEDGKYVLTIDKTLQKLHIYDLLREEYIMTDCLNSWRYELKPKVGKVDKQFFLTVLDFIIANVQLPEEKSIVKKKSVNESVWGGMLDRSVGDSVRKEDDINNLDMDGLYNLIFDLYELVDEDSIPLKGHVSQSRTYFHIPIFKNHHIYPLDVIFDDNKISEIKLMTYMVCIENFKHPLTDKFSIIKNPDDSLKITSKDGEVSNQICMDLIKTIVEDAPEPYLKKRGE